jgi:hypothetical protein
MGFSDWVALDDAGVAAAVDAPGAVQLCRADKSLIEYPSGKSTMVFYFYAARSVRQALRRLFADELTEPGARGEGPLLYRVCEGGDDAQRWLEQLFDEFVERFGRPPILHVVDDDDE